MQFKFPHKEKEIKEDRMKHESKAHEKFESKAHEKRESKEEEKEEHQGGGGRCMGGGSGGAHKFVNGKCVHCGAKAQGGGMEKTMHEFKAGELHSGSKKGPVVKSRKQAIAIGMNS